MLISLFFFLMIRRPPRSPLFPYTTSSDLGEAIAADLQKALQDTIKDAVINIFSAPPDRKSTRLNSSHTVISYAVFCLKKKIIHTGNYLANGARRRLRFACAKNPECRATLA